MSIVNNPTDRLSIVDPDALSSPPPGFEEPLELLSDTDLCRANRSLVYATLRAENDVAVHLLELVRATAPAQSYLSQSLVTSSFIGYELRLDFETKSNSWSIGAGRLTPWPASRDSGVDFLLCAPGSSVGSSRARKAIDDIHGLFSLHPESGMITFSSKSDKPVYYHGRSSGETTVVTQKGQRGGFGSIGERQQTCVMRDRHNRLQIGSYEFTLVYEIPTDIRLLSPARRLRNQHMKIMNGQPSSLLPTYPPLRTKLIGHVAVLESESRSQERTVHIGVDACTGKPLHVTELAFNKHTRWGLQSEFKGLKTFAGDVSDGVVGIIDAWCEHGRSPPCGLIQIGKDKNFTERMYYSRALATSTWTFFYWVGVPFDNKLNFFKQVLLGLRNIHNEGLVHGYINPDNLVIVSYERTRARKKSCKESSIAPYIISRSFNLRAAIDQATCKGWAISPDSKLGPSTCWGFDRWPPPERWQKELGQPYTERGDIFSLALCFLNTYVDIDKINPIIKMDQCGHNRVMHELGKLEHSLPPYLYSLMEDMLHWAPQLRPTADEALRHPVWRGLGGARTEDAASRREHEDLERVKRVRFSKPEQEAGPEAEPDEGLEEPEEGTEEGTNYGAEDVALGGIEEGAEEDATQEATQEATAEMEEEATEEATEKGTEQGIEDEPELPPTQSPLQSPTQQSSIIPPLSPTYQPSMPSTL